MKQFCGCKNHRSRWKNNLKGLKDNVAERIQDQDILPYMACNFAINMITTVERDQDIRQASRPRAKSFSKGTGRFSSSLLVFVSVRVLRIDWQ